MQDPTVEDYSGNSQRTQAGKTNDGESTIRGLSIQSESSGGTEQMNSQDGLKVLGGGVKRLLQMIQDLRHLGIEQLVPPLPKICVVGEQSTGKSSLIEGMSDIKVPRSTGTCTRCPLEINLTESAEANPSWKCEVYLLKNFTYLGTQGALKRLGASRNQPLGPWLAQIPPVRQLFATVTAKDEVGETIRLAQLAILNPGVSYERYRPGFNAQTAETMQVKFSPNLVQVNISSPGLPNLSFYDLPGIINVAECDDESYLVDLVKNLVKEYIKSENCIILLALPMTVDANNSSAVALIKEMKGAQQRAVGVLTKPDRVQLGEPLDEWISILKGERITLGHGYHVIKNNPDPAVDNVTARIQEMEFFRDHEPYATKLLEYRHIFGTLQLQAALSDKLTAQIRTNLPTIIQQVEYKLRDVESELGTLPRPPAATLLYEVIRQVNLFESHLKDHINGSGSNDNPFISNWRKDAELFLKLLLETRPVLYMKAEKSMPDIPLPRKSTVEAFEISDDELPHTPSHSSKRAQPTLVKPSAQKRPRTMAEIPQHKPEKVNGARYSRESIKAQMDRWNDGHHSSSHPMILQCMIKTATQHWPKLLEQFLDRSEKSCKKMLEEQANGCFGPWNETELNRTIRLLIDSFLQEAIEAQRLAATDCVDMELQSAFVLNGELLGQAERKALGELQDTRKDFRAREHLVRKGQGQKDEETDQAFKQRIARVKDDELGLDPWDQEVRVMAILRGYYYCAASHVARSVAMGIKTRLFSRLSKELPDKLVEGLGLDKSDANERCALALAVDPQIEQRRQTLQEEQTALVKAIDRLNFERGIGEPDDEDKMSF